MPLQGILLIQYDYQQIAKRYTREFFLKQPPGQFWKYPDLWPLRKHPEEDGRIFADIQNEELMSVALPPNKIHPFNWNGSSLMLMDDTNNPTFSYKDRASILVALKSRQLGINEIAAASTGNAGSSLAGICTRLGLTARLFLPESIPEAKLMQSLAYGAKIHLVKGDYDLAFDLCLEFSEKMGWYNRNTALNPLTIEGKKSAAYDIFIEAKGKIPDYIFVPVGDGVIIGGIFKGFRELQQLGVIESLPRLVAVQSSGSDALVRYMEKSEFTYRPANTLADSISAGAPRNLYHAASAVQESNGFALRVEDSEIVEAQRTLARQTGILAEPAAAAGFAGYLKASSEQIISKNKTAMLLITGSGLKDSDSLKRLHRIPQPMDENYWRQQLKEKISL
ncbi:MAG: pyridoxal-phosphate dependent enzyme [Calditrichia bacterium]